MFRICGLYVLGAMAAVCEQGALDPAFDQIPFEDWLKGSEQASIAWSLYVSPPHTMTGDLRLETVVWIKIDGREFVTRKKPGQVTAYLEIRDPENRIYRNHCVLKLTDERRLPDLRSIDFRQRVLLRPGEYQLTAAVYDSQSKEHGVKRTTLRIGEPLRGFLAGAPAPRDLPSVELLGAADSPLAALKAPASRRIADLEFERIRFDDWLKGKDDTHIRWSMRTFPATLSEHQRLDSSIWAVVDADEFEKRPDRGQMVLFLEIRDHDNHVYRAHRALSPNGHDMDKFGVRFIQHFSILPGDYEVAAAVYDKQSKEHSLKRTKLHVSKLFHDPLPDSWRDLPSVSFSGGSPRLFLPLQTEKPVRIEVLVNQSFRGYMGSMLSALDVISQMEIRNGSMNVTALDLERRQVSFTQEVAGKLDLRGLNAAMSKNNPNLIDMHDLENYIENAQFFVSEVAKRLEPTRPGEPARVLIVLSAPRTFPKEEDLRPIEASSASGSRVFYIRFESILLGPALPPPQPPSPGSWQVPPSLPTAPVFVPSKTNNSDSLERTLKPLEPRLFEVTTPADFRKALASIMNEISRLI